MPTTLCRVSLVQNAPPDDPQVLENTEVMQGFRPCGDVQVTWEQRERLGVQTHGGDTPATMNRTWRPRPPVISSRVSNTLSCLGCRGAMLEAGSLEGSGGIGQAVRGGQDPREGSATLIPNPH